MPIEFRLAKGCCLYEMLYELGQRNLRGSTLQEMPGRRKQMVLYDLRIELEELDDGGDYRYMATSPDLPGLIVVGDTAEEVLALAPQVASALIASLKAAGDPLPETVLPVTSLPFSSRVAVTA